MKKRYIVYLSTLISLCLQLPVIALAAGESNVVVIPLGGDDHYMYWQGEWAASTAYKVGDGVTYDGSSYLCINAHTADANTYPPDAMYWDILATGGSDGATGLEGPQGIQGLKGDKGDKGDTGEPGPSGPSGTSSWTDGSGQVTTDVNVGIGTTSPVRKLHISDTMRLEPISEAPSNSSYGDIYYDVTDALCVYMADGWSKLTGNGYCGSLVPIADAGEDQTVFNNSLVTLDGSRSFDPNNNSLTYKWTRTDRPVGSTAVLSNRYSDHAQFTPDFPGNYTVSLIVNNGKKDSQIDEMKLTVINRRPVADAGNDGNWTSLYAVKLNGSNSYDPDSDPLTYAWSFTDVPVGSNAVLTNPTTANPSFLADFEGTYTVKLIVNDRWEDSFPDTVTVTITTPSLLAFPDTGQTSSYTTTFGEDSDYTINPPSYSLNGDGTTTDNVTGLMWQSSDDDMYYNWYEASGIADATYNPGTATDVCGSLNTGGYNDWRLPTRKELVSILDMDRLGPSIKIAAFPDATTSKYWTSTDINSGAWAVEFVDGTPTRRSKWLASHVRCVRGGQIPDASFIDNGDSTVTDSATGFMWQQTQGGTKAWEQALAYCEGLTLAGYNDWRLPNFKELNTLVDGTITNLGVDLAYFPDEGVYWSSTTKRNNSSVAWEINFHNGYSSFSNKTNSIDYVRCVR